MRPGDRSHEETLDPADWQQFGRLAHQMVDDTLEYLASLRSQPAWRPMPAEVRASFEDPVPWTGEGEEAAYRAFVDRVRPYTNGNLHPRFYGWVMGNGTPLAMMAEMLAAGINPHMAGFDQAPARVEHEVLRWMAELMGMPGASGLLVSGATMASTLGLAIARHVKAGFDVREEGLQGGRPRMVFYGSSETHSWARQAAEILGLGSRSFRTIGVDEEYRIDVSALRAAIREDRAAGLHPFCVLGTAGTVNTGATDDLDALADLCRDEDLWFHVDGAFGSMAYLSERLRPRLAGMERADSLGVDLHKWGYLPFECGCVLVRDPEAHRGVLDMRASYLRPTDRGVIAGGLPFADRGLELSRNFKALKVWMSFRAHGVGTMARLIEQNVAQSEYLAEQVRGHPELELLAPVALNIVCLRYVPSTVDGTDLDELNHEILLRLQEEGVAVPSGTLLQGRFAIRVANVNHRTRREDLDTLLGGVVRIGRAVTAGMQPVTG